jgi:hypothetical protein
LACSFLLPPFAICHLHAMPKIPIPNGSSRRSWKCKWNC